jgi:NAD(P)-dependent dehydrogenase (short-subunit alcohol dehydrogenase family)
MAETVRDAVVVITGASSGIGRATALAFAARGARLVLAARRAAALDDARGECERAGASVLVVPTDVTDEAAVERLARDAVARFGRLDVWANVAGVYAVGRFEDVPMDVFRRVLDTNFLGTVYGARAALRQFRAQQRGVLVNVASVLGRAGTAYTAPYTASKFAVVGFSECLRQETRDLSDVHVCTVLPASIDTPLFQHAANYVARPLKALRPVYAPERVARTIVGLAESPERQVVVGNAGRAMLALHALAPAAYDRITPRQLERTSFGEGRVAPSPGNVLAPMAEGTSVHGGWGAEEGNGRLARGALAVAAAAAVPVLAWWLLPRAARA